MRIQGPTRLDDYSEPEPDVMLLRRRDDFLSVEAILRPPMCCCSLRCPTPSLLFDRNAKAAAYAAAGIPEVWIVNRPDRRIESYSDPTGDAYARSGTTNPAKASAPRRSRTWFCKLIKSSRRKRTDA